MRTSIVQQKTHRPVQFEITEQTRESLAAWIRHAGLKADDFLSLLSKMPGELMFRCLPAIDRNEIGPLPMLLQIQVPIPD